MRVWRDNDDDACYPWASENSNYTHDGAVFIGWVDGQDLVEFLGEKITITAAD